MVRHVERQVRVDSHGRDLAELVRRLQGEAVSADLRPALKRWGIEAGGGAFAVAAAIAHSLAARTGTATPLSGDFLAAVSEGATSLPGLWAAFQKHGICPAAEMRGAKKPSQRAERAAEKVRALGLRLRWISESGPPDDGQLAEARRQLAAGRALLAQGPEGAVLVVGFAEGAFLAVDGVGQRNVSFEDARARWTALAWVDAPAP